jgi:hypothetical protein
MNKHGVKHSQSRLFIKRIVVVSTLRRLHTSWTSLCAGTFLDYIASSTQPLLRNIKAMMCKSCATRLTVIDDDGAQTRIGML